MYMKRRRTRRRTRRKRRRCKTRRRRTRRRKKRSYKRQRGGNPYALKMSSAIKPKRMSTSPAAGMKCSAKGGCMNASWVKGTMGTPEIVDSFNQEKIEATT